MTPVGRLFLSTSAAATVAALALEVSTVRRSSSHPTVAPDPPLPETMLDRGQGEVEGVYAQSPDLVKRVPGLCSWSEWYEPPTLLKNGHAHTIWAAKARKVQGCRYARKLLRTKDGGTLALDFLVEGADETIINEEKFPTSDRPFALLLSGLGGGSQDSYVRAMAIEAKARGFDVGVLNMRSCGDSPVTSPRFFSAYRGSTDDVGFAVDYLRAEGYSSVVAVGWSNSGTIVINGLADSSICVDAACALAAPLNMPKSSANLERWFHGAVYDRSIGTSLGTKFAKNQHLFLPQGTPIPAYLGGTFIPDVEKAANARSIRAIDEALTAPCFGFPDVDAYYAYSSSHQRVKDVHTPLLVVNAADDPIALWGDFDKLVSDVRTNPNVVLAVTDHGGHLGWCDAANPRGSSAWIERCALDFLSHSLTVGPRKTED